jgi:hypothetical protein
MLHEGKSAQKLCELRSQNITYGYEERERARGGEREGEERERNGEE